MKSRTMILAILLTLVLAVFLSACGQSVADAKQQFCDSLNKLNTAVDKLQNVDESTKIEDVKQIKAEVENAWKELEKSSAALKKVQMKESQDAYEQVKKEVDKAVTGESTLGESAATVAAGAKKLDATLKAINTTICGVK
jgi:biopolymer transport protein ExbB/TolQ